MGCRTFVLDGDNIRHGLCSDLGFSARDRVENIRRIGETLKLFVGAGILTMSAFISPYARDRERVKALLGEKNFIEIYCDCSIETCEKRDPKGMYARARSGQILEFTGISAPYEPPENPDLHLKTGELSVQECVNEIIRHLLGRSPRIFLEPKRNGE
jgi:adenylylsulfate kinase